MVVVIAKLKAKPGKGDELAEKFVAMVDWVTENEANTLTYICNRSNKDPDEFVFYERYPDHAALSAHSSSPRFQEFVADVQGLLVGGMEVELLDELAAKL